MKNSYKYKLERIVEIKVSGKNINSYIKRVILKNNINILKMTYINYKEVLIILRYEDYLKLSEYKSIYDVKVVRKYGRLRFREVIKKNIILIIGIVFAIMFIWGLSHFIFEVEVIHSSSSIRDLVYRELDKYDVKKFSLRKDYYEIEKIEEEILLNNKDKLEWIEIINSGVKYIVRVEERKLNRDEEEFQYQSIVALKNCVLYKVEAVSGEKVKNVNEYVKKGDVVISGYITLADGSSSVTMAKGKVLGEVWYTIEVEYPFTYYEERLTGKSKKFYVFDFLGLKIPLFQFGKYKSFNKNNKIIFKNNMLNISFYKQKQYEMEIISDIYTEEEVVDRAIDLGIEKLKQDNEKILDIIDEDILVSRDMGQGMYVKFFVKAIEDVGEVMVIDEEKNIVVN